MRPGVTILAVGALLVAGALGALGDRPPLAFTDSFREAPESVTAQQLIGERYKPGVLGPDEAVVASSRVRDGGRRALAGHPACSAAGATAISSDRKLTLVEIVPDGRPVLAGRARTACPRCARRCERPARGEFALLGGPAAEAYDARETLRARREGDRAARRCCWCWLIVGVARARRWSRRCTWSGRSCCPTRSRSASARCSSRTVGQPAPTRRCRRSRSSSWSRLASITTSS